MRRPTRPLLTAIALSGILMPQAVLGASDIATFYEAATADEVLPGKLRRMATELELRILQHGATSEDLGSFPLLARAIAQSEPANRRAMLRVLAILLSTGTSETLSDADRLLARDAALRQLNESDSRLRSGALALLQHVVDRSVIDAALAALEDDDPNLRAQAQVLLAQQKHTPYRDAVLSGLGDLAGNDDPAVRASARRVLSLMR